MQIIKFIAGLGCLVLALWLGLLVLAYYLAVGYLDLAFAFPAIGIAVIGWLLILKRKSPLSRGGRIWIPLVTSLLGVFITVIVIPNFVRMKYESAQNSCVNKLRQLEAAKQEWALETGATNGTIVTANDLTPYVQLDSKGNLPRCPAGGTYIMGRVGEDVKCSIGTSDWPNSHVLSGATDFHWWTNFKEAYRRLLGLRHDQKP